MYNNELYTINVLERKNTDCCNHNIANRIGPFKKLNKI